MFERIAKRLREKRTDLIERVADLVAEPESPQRCSDWAYVQSLHARLDEPHVLPINKLVERIEKDHPDKYVPYVAPTFGGVDARLLALFSSPGSTNRAGDRSRMLCVENDDASATRHKLYLEQYGIKVVDTVSWNAFPWSGYDKNRTLRETRVATESLVELLELLPELEIVMLHGRVAQDAWERLRQYDSSVKENIRVIETYHLSARLIDPEHNSRSRIEFVENDLHNAFYDAAMHLQGIDSKQFPGE